MQGEFERLRDQPWLLEAYHFCQILSRKTIDGESEVE